MAVLRRFVRPIMCAFVASGSVASAGCAEVSTEATPERGGSTIVPGPSGDADRVGCAQEAYTEDLPLKASLRDLSFSSATASDYLLSALDLRYPIGADLVRGGLSSRMAQSQGNCVELFLSNTSSAQNVLRQASTVVHECGHFYDLGESRGNTSTYVIRPDLVFTCEKGDTTRRGGETFARSLIKQDAYYALRPSCSSSARGGCDMYAPIYLDGDATDAVFQSGDQGYNLLLEEAVQYVNSLAAGLAFADQLGNVRVSERDGILTLLWYVERYLAMARTQYPDAYARISEDSCWRQATLTVWDRAWFYLRATAGMASLGLEDSKIEELVDEPDLLSEIDALRALECQ